MPVRRRLFGEETLAGPEVRPFAMASDHAECRRLHREFGTTYYFATRCFPATVRRRTHAVYAFVRVPDEWVDNPGALTVSQRRELLSDYRAEFLRGLDGVRPETAVLRAFCDVCREVSMPVEEPMLFLDAMEQDLTASRYPTYEALRGYMRGSASAVGVMMCSVLGVPPDPETLHAARSLGEAMQLTNFLRDVGEDLVRGRVYLPEEDMETFGITIDDLRAGVVDERFRNLMRFEIERARALYAIADEGIPRLPRHARSAVRLARVLYAAILDKIVEVDYDVFAHRARTTRWEKIRAMTRIKRD